MRQDREVYDTAATDKR
jgi:hypothetical protein